MIEGYTLHAWRDPTKVVITKNRCHGAWQLTIFARRTVEVETWGQAMEYVRLIGCFGPRW